MLTLLSVLLEPILWALFGARHEPPPTEMNVLGDISPKRSRRSRFRR